MQRLVVRSFAISLDGFSAAPDQSQEEPFGRDGLKLMDWVFATKFFNRMYGRESWRGWWGENPPYHHPVFVLCHEPRAPLVMEGGTSFTFVTDGIESALRQAFAAAQGRDVRLAGGAATVRQYLKAGLIDELHLVQVPLLLGQGERIFEGLGGVEKRYECVEFSPSKAVSHLRIIKKEEGYAS